MYKVLAIMLASLAILFGSMVLPGPEIAQARSHLCTDGQQMAAVNACICRPPLKFLPGNICGSGRQVRPTPQPGTPTTVGIRATCELNMVPAASGCRCVAPMVVLPDGRCGNAAVAGQPCREGESTKTRCKCNPPLMQSAQRKCIRCLPGDGDKIVNGRCVQNTKR